ncbi:hypothetical protein GW750_03585 [bacterium]|nr:hypothetical protein [bacterium]
MTLFSQNIKSPIVFQNSFFLPKILRFSSKKACHVPLQKLRYKAAKTAATINHTNVGNKKSVNADKKLQTTEINKDLFLPKVSAKTDVGNSNNQITVVAMFDNNTISNVLNHTC